MSTDYVDQVTDHTQSDVDGNVQTNTIENFWRLLKRRLKGSRAVPFCSDIWTSKRPDTSSIRTMTVGVGDCVTRAEASRFIGYANTL
jgi:hypothetical protein